METIGERIKKMRKNKGITQEELAKVMEIKRATLSCIECGLTDISTKQMQAICDFFSVSADYVLKGEENEKTISKEEQEIIVLVRKDQDIRETLMKFLEVKKKTISRIDVIMA